VLQAVFRQQASVLWIPRSCDRRPREIICDPTSGIMGTTKYSYWVDLPARTNCREIRSVTHAAHCDRADRGACVRRRIGRRRSGDSALCDRTLTRVLEESRHRQIKSL